MLAPKHDETRQENRRRFGPRVLGFERPNPRSLLPQGPHVERSDFGARQILRMHKRRTQNSVDIPTSLGNPRGSGTDFGFCILSSMTNRCLLMYILGGGRGFL
jgi:hypothetical protein